MKEELQSYFAAEKKESYLFIIIAIIALVVGSLGVYYYKEAVWLGAAIPLIIIGLIQLLVGATILFRTDRQVSSLLNQLKETPQQFVRAELPRMEKVNANFGNFRKVEMLLFVLGFFFAIMGGLVNWGPFVLGTGVGLAIQSAIMLVLDLFAEMRASSYLHKIVSLKKKYGY